MSCCRRAVSVRLVVQHKGDHQVHLVLHDCSFRAAHVLLLDPRAPGCDARSYTPARAPCWIASSKLVLDVALISLTSATGIPSPFERCARLGNAGGSGHLSAASSRRSAPPRPALRCRCPDPVPSTSPRPLGLLVKGAYSGEPADRSRASCWPGSSSRLAGDTIGQVRSSSDLGLEHLRPAAIAVAESGCRRTRSDARSDIQSRATAG